MKRFPLKHLPLFFTLFSLLGCQAQVTSLKAPHPKAEKIVAAAKARIGITTSYDPAYVSLSFPNGDVPNDRGVCTDVIIRSLRAINLDLQALVNADMKKNFAQYPKIWGLKRTDRSIDHRRVPNLRTYFKRMGYDVSPHQKPSKNKTDYLPGDLVTCTVAGKLPHIMIVSDRSAADGTPLIIHNIGSGTQEQNSLFTYPLTGHYRLLK